MEITKEYLSEVCKIRQGSDCCRYLTVQTDGIHCGKDYPPIKAALDRKVLQMTAKGDNCAGWDSYQEAFQK